MGIDWSRRIIMHVFGQSSGIPIAIMFGFVVYSFISLYIMGIIYMLNRDIETFDITDTQKNINSVLAINALSYTVILGILIALNTSYKDLILRPY